MEELSLGAYPSSVQMGNTGLRDFGYRTRDIIFRNFLTADKDGLICWVGIFPQGATMKLVVGLLLWPVVLFLQAVCGVLYSAKTPRIALYQKIARLALFASVAVISMIPLSLLATSFIGVKLLLLLGMLLLFVFVVFGNLCDNQAEDKDMS